MTFDKKRHSWVHPDFIVDGQMPKFIEGGVPPREAEIMGKTDRLHIQQPEQRPKSLHKRGGDLRGLEPEVNFRISFPWKKG